MNQITAGKSCKKHCGFLKLFAEYVEFSYMHICIKKYANAHMELQYMEIMYKFPKFPFDSHM